MRTKEKELFERIQRVGAKFGALERSFVFQHGDVNLHASEIHFMMAVNYNPDVNASGLAKRLGVTKGAISQTLSRLERKGVVEKESAPFHSNELRISLTPFGRDALAAFRAQNRDRWSDVTTCWGSLSSVEYEGIIRFLARLEGFLDSLG